MHAIRVNSHKTTAADLHSSTGTSLRRVTNLVYLDLHSETYQFKNSKIETSSALLIDVKSYKPFPNIHVSTVFK